MRHFWPAKIITLAIIMTISSGLTVPETAVAQTRTQLKAQQVANPTFERGVQAFNAGDYEIALRTFLKLARRGDPQSQYYLAYMYDVCLL